MLINKHNWQDVKRYYQGTIVKFQGENKDGKERVWKIVAVDSSQVIAEDSSGEQVYIDLSRPYKLDYVIPKKTVYQHGDAAAVLTRIPARMWRKGMDEKNTQIHGCTAEGKFVGLSLSLGIIDGFVNKPGYFDYQDARNQFLAGTSLQSAALSSRILVSRKGGVFIDQVLVGQINFEDNYLQILSIFSSDVVKYFPGVKVKCV